MDSSDGHCRVYRRVWERYQDAVLCNIDNSFMAWSGATVCGRTPLQILIEISPENTFETPRRDTRHTETAKPYHSAANQRKASVARVVRDF